MYDAKGAICPFGCALAKRLKAILAVAAEGVLGTD